MRVASHNTIVNRIRNFLAARPKEVVFLRAEFDGFAARRTGVDKALRVLVAEGVLVRGGYGVLVRGRWRKARAGGASKVIPAVSLEVYEAIVHQKLLARSRAKTRKPRHGRQIGVSQATLARKIIRGAGIS